jgi:two-component system, OmpR family, phosphate regulon response regulator OmpR
MGGCTGHVLVVDRDQRVRTALGALARAAGHRVVVAAGAAEARLMVVEQAPTAAVVDPMLPTLAAGCALVRDLSAEGIGVLALSLRREAGRAAREAGAADFLTKNCTPEQVLEGLGRLFADSPAPIG